MKRLKSKVFYKYFLSFLFIFLIPLIIIGAFFYRNAVVVLQEEIESSNLAKVAQIKNQIELQYKALEQTAARMAFSSKLQAYKLVNAGLNRQQAIEELGNFRANNPIAEDVFLYLNGDDKIYSASGVSAVTTLLDDMYRFSEWNEPAFMEELNGLEAFRIRPAESVDYFGHSNKSVLTYMFPIPLHSPSPKGTVLFFIEEDRITELFDTVLGDLNGNAYLLGGENQILASKKQGDFGKSIGDVEWLHEGIAEGLSTIQLDDHPVSLAKANLEGVEWSIVLAVPQEQFFERAFEMRTFIMMLIVLLLLFGIGIAVLLSVFHYRPVHQLFESVTNYWAPKRAIKHGNEFEHIRSSLEEVYDAQLELQEQIENQRPLVRDQCIIRLLKNDFLNERDRDAMLSSNRIHLPGPHYFVIYLEWPSSSEDQVSVSNKEKIMEQLACVTIAYCSGYGVELFTEAAIACVVSVPDTDDPEQLRKQFVIGIMRQLEQQFHMTTTVGVGGLYDDLGKLNRSFIESSAAFEYMFKVGRGGPIYFEAIQSIQDHTTWYPLEDQLRLIQSMKEGNRSVALDAVSSIFENIRAREQSLLLLKCMCYELVNAILKTINELQLKDVFRGKLEHLLNFNSIQELEMELPEIILEVCHQIDIKRENGQLTIRNAIIHYLQENFGSEQLSLEQTAEHFQLSATHVSRLIKEESGYPFVEFVFRLRMERIKDQLACTDLPIKDIIVAAGYADISSFHRKFKSREGITPGQYRKQHIE
jgi:AraC-like DNA-binding protein